MSFSKRNLLVSGLTLAALLGAGAVMAQERAVSISNCHCSQPVNVHINKTSGPTPFPGDFSSVTNGQPVV